MGQNNLAVLAAASLLSASIGAGAALLTGVRAEPSPPTAAPIQAPAEDLDTLLARQAELERSLEALRARLEMAPAADSRAQISSDQISAALERWMRENRAQAGALAAAAPEQPTDPGSAAREREARIADAIAKLTGDELDDSEISRLWKELFAAGLGDQVLAEFEALVERDPNNPDARVDLAHAYLHKLFNSPTGPESGLWGTKADKAFDVALALDANHWKARFDKAVSLSHWPAFLGKQPEAIKHFEILIDQQSRQPQQAHFAHTHLILGNMYLQMGQKDKALAAWQQGAAQFPDDEALRKQLELAGG